MGRLKQYKQAFARKSKARREKDLQKNAKKSYKKVPDGVKITPKLTSRIDIKGVDRKKRPRKAVAAAAPAEKPMKKVSFAEKTEVIPKPKRKVTFASQVQVVPQRMGNVFQDARKRKMQKQKQE